MAGTSTGAGTKTAVTGVEAGVNDTDRTTDHPTPRSATIAAAGVTTGTQFAALMSALMSDVITGSIDPVKANAAVNAGGKLLKMVEMEYKYGPRGHAPERVAPTINLIPEG